MVFSANQLFIGEKPEYGKFVVPGHDAEEAHHFMGNGIVVNGCYTKSHTSPQLEVILGEEGLKPVISDTSEFEKAGGSCFCMKLFLP